MGMTHAKAARIAKERSRFVNTEEVRHPLFYIAQERAFAPGIVREWPKVWRMQRLCPNGRAVLRTHAQIADELRRIGYTVIAPPEGS